MKHIIVNDEWINLSVCSSLGNQCKWQNRHNGSFLKGALFNVIEWEDYLVECIGTRIAEQIRINNFRLAKYEECTYEYSGKIYKGCWSPNFLQEDEEFTTLYHYMLRTGLSWANKSSAVEYYAQLSNIYMQATGNMQTEYLAGLFVIDYLLFNPDRHLRNFGLILNHKYNKTYPAPVFDFGMGMFMGSTEEMNAPILKRMRRVKYKPFGISFDKALKAYQAQYDLSSLLPEPINMSGVKFPNKASKALLAITSKELRHHVKGVDIC